MEVPGDSKSDEEIYWFEKLQKADSKSGCLVQKSVTSSSSSVSSLTTVAGMTGIDTRGEGEIKFLPLIKAEDDLGDFFTSRFSC